LNYNEEIEVKSKNLRSRSAMKALLKIKGIHDKTLRGFVDGEQNLLQGNYLYGFKPVNTNQILWILDAKMRRNRNQRQYKL
jgi:hypothetical protein